VAAPRVFVQFTATFLLRGAYAPIFTSIASVEVGHDAAQACCKAGDSPSVSRDRHSTAVDQGLAL